MTDAAPTPEAGPIAAPTTDQPQTVFILQKAPGTKKGLGITSMVLGISAVIFSWTAVFGFILLIAAFIFGIASLMRKELPRGFAITGIVLGSVAVVVVILILVIVSVFAGAIASSVGSY